MPTRPLRDHRACSVARSLAILGERWTFLILREAFFGVRHYDAFRANLGIATNILSARLKTLVEHGILERKRDEGDARRFTYRLTEKGLGLYPITLAFLAWGDRWLAGEEGPPLLLHHEPCGHRLQPVLCCACCGKPVDPREVRYQEAGDASSPGALAGDHAPKAPAPSRTRPNRRDSRPKGESTGRRRRA